MISTARLSSSRGGPSPELLAFARRQARDAAHHGAERRREVRVRVALPALVQLVNRDYQALAPPLDVVLHDLSRSGFRILSEQRLAYEIVALRFTLADEDVILAGTVQWRSPCGPFYTCGCAVTAKLAQWPADADSTAAFVDNVAEPVDESLRDTKVETRVPRTLGNRRIATG